LHLHHRPASGLQEWASHAALEHTHTSNKYALPCTPVPHTT
jgi:hypothetical protein